MTDDKHFNLWEEWVANAFKIQEFSAFNSLWLAYFIAGGIGGAQNQHHIFKQVLKTVYTSLPDLIGILFLVRKYSPSRFTFCPSRALFKSHFNYYNRILTLI
jgi:hypothetical protein